MRPFKLLDQNSNFLSEWITTQLNNVTGNKYYFIIDGLHIHEIDPTYNFTWYRTEGGTIEWKEIKIDFVEDLDEDTMQNIEHLIIDNHIVNIINYNNDVIFNCQLHNSEIEEIQLQPFSQIFLIPQNVIIL